MREYLLTVSTKPATRGPAPSRVEDVAWQATVVDPEHYWQHALPSDLPAPTVSSEGEQMLTVLQSEIDLRDVLLNELQPQINRRDALLREADERMQQEVQRRDRIIEDLRARLPLWRKLWARVTRTPI